MENKYGEQSAQVDVPCFSAGKVIPKIIHQTYYRKKLPSELDKIVQELRENNPGWEYRFYDDQDIEGYISQNYGDKILGYYHRINNVYGAARADLFRYLLMYKEGGVYLDIKSTIAKPLDEILAAEDQFLLCGWDNHKVHKELQVIDGGEYQQWHIICAPGSPFLRAVICAVLANIDSYKPWRQGVGKIGVLRVTGPIAYTLAIAPLLSKYPYRYERTNKAFALVYSATRKSHKKIYKKHYSKQTATIIRLDGMNAFLGQLYSLYRKIRNLLKKFVPKNIRKFISDMM
ncbi:MAG: hypothetical protein MI685_11415 [Chlorobiales bacterium]|nr:hypothetical protein [Chlorobiales bacterium]